MAEPKTKPTNQSVDKYLKTIPDAVKREDSIQVTAMMTEITGHKPKIWGTSIVGFGSRRYKYASGQEGDWPVVAFSPRKQNLTLYIMGSLGEDNELLKKLGKHSTGGSCLYIKRLSDVDIPTLKKLIRQSVKAKR
jgi:hypothetical protein